jgi:triacylglycerol lipase
MHCRIFASVVALSSIGLVCGCGSEAESSGQQSEDLLAAAPLGPEPSGVATRFPILLGHGFGGSDSNLTFIHVDDALREDGHHAVRAEVPPFAPVAVRAEVLADQVDALLEETGAAKVNLVSHSMGGLDARELVSILGYGDRVASITTISTPHWGSAIADVSLGLLAGVPDDALDALAKAFGGAFSAHADDPDLRAAFADLAEANAEAFNEAHPDDPEVMYQSWAGVSSVACIPNPADVAACEGSFLWHKGRADCMDPLLTAMAGFVAHGSELLPNDGLVTVESAKLGTFRGCVPADHADEIGQFHDKPYSANVRTGFDYIRFYRNLAYELAEQGF